MVLQLTGSRHLGEVPGIIVGRQKPPLVAGTQSSSGELGGEELLRSFLQGSSDTHTSWAGVDGAFTPPGFPKKNGELFAILFRCQPAHVTWLAQLL